MYEQIEYRVEEPIATVTLRLMNESLVRPDFKEGVQSFLEGRPPRFERVKAES